MMLTYLFVLTGAVYSVILAVEMLLYALGANFVFVLYTSMAQITVCLSLTKCDKSKVS
jgi:hypothetical protein